MPASCACAAALPATRATRSRASSFWIAPQLGTLIEFYSQTCRSGVDPFTGLRHPRTDDATAVLGFAAPPVEYHLNRRQVQVTLVLETR